MPSEKVLKQKKAVVNDVSEKLKSACAGVIVDYKGINVYEDTKLRRELNEADVDYFVIKNTLLSRAMKEVGIEIESSVLKGTTAIAISKTDYIASARILCKYAGNSKTFNVKSGFVEGKAISVNEINELAELPSKEILVARVIGGLNAPISGLANVLNGTIKGLVVALNAIVEKQSA